MVVGSSRVTGRFLCCPTTRTCRISNAAAVSSNAWTLGFLDMPQITRYMSGFGFWVCVAIIAVSGDGEPAIDSSWSVDCHPGRGSGGTGDSIGSEDSPFTVSFSAPLILVAAILAGRETAFSYLH